MTMSGRGRSSSSDSGMGDPGSRLGKPVYHVKKKNVDEDLFTESAFVYMTKTWWARMTSRTALETYEGTLNHLAAIIALTIQTMAAIIVAVSKQAWSLTVQLARVGAQVGGALMRVALKGGRTAGGVVAGGGRATGSAVAGGARGVWGVMTGGARATRNVVAGGARATRSAVAGGARITKGAAAGGARLKRRAVDRRRAAGRPVPRAERPTPRVARPAAPAGQRPTRPKPTPRPDRSSVAGQPIRETPQPRPAGVAAKGQRTPRATRVRPQAARPASPPTGQRPQRAAASAGTPRPQSIRQKPDLRREQVFAVPETSGRRIRRRRANLGSGFRRGAGKALRLPRAVTRFGAVGLLRLLRFGWSVVRPGSRLLSPAMRWTARHWQYAAIPMTVSLLALMIMPIGWDVVGSFGRNEPAPATVTSEERIASAETNADELSSEEQAPEEPEPGISLPKISVPKISGPLVTLPSISLPAFVKGPAKKVDQLLSGSLIPPRSSVLVADFTDRFEGDEQLGFALALVLEAELARGSNFTVPKRERTLILANGGEVGDLALPEARALSLVQVTSSAAVISGELALQDSVPNLAIVVRDSLGEELHRMAIEIGEGGPLEAVGLAAAQLAMRLGDQGNEERAAAEPFLTRSLPAARAYAAARVHLYRSDYRRVIEAARQAIAEDSAFATAYRLLAEAYGLSGQRALARQTIEIAWKYRARLSERETLRLTADRDALAGRHTDAILGYDHLFTEFRDDASALKSQAILQEMVGVRGGGSGNLRVAYSIDPVDWPPLERIAQFLGYRGRIPDYSGLGPADSE